MPRVLLTAFKPYDRWDINASWLAVVELTKDMPTDVDLTTRLYPVDYAAMRDQLDQDLDDGYDFAIHVGQAPGSSKICLESIGLNLQGGASPETSNLPPLDPEGPVAYRSDLPLATWSKGLREQGIPADVSYHAGTYLCNAALYQSLHLTAKKKLTTRSVFIHIPLDVSQVVSESHGSASLPTSVCADALRFIVGQLLLV